jgi:hypothetical protein
VGFDNAGIHAPSINFQDEKSKNKKTARPGGDPFRFPARKTRKELVPGRNFCLTPGVSWELAWLLAPAALALVLATAVGPLRRAYANGWRCAVRHEVLWKIPASFAGAYAFFHIGAEFILRWRLGEGAPAALTGPPPDFAVLALDQAPRALFPAAEMLAADLNCLAATFPLSAVFGGLFLLNGRGAASELRRALCRRFGFRGWILFGLLVVSALCALLKPVTLLFLPELGNYFSLRETLLAGIAVNALAFVFEYLLGTAVQIFLLLTAYGWVRGRHFPRHRLLHFAVRRLGFVIKWALVLMAATLAFIHLPLFVEVLLTGAPPAMRVELFARPVLLLAMLLGATVQIRLALHNDSLRGALSANAGFLRRHGLLTVLFLLGAWGLLLTIKAVEIAGLAWLEGTLAGSAWILGLQVLAASAGGWILASWVCFYTSLDKGRREVAF